MGKKKTQGKARGSVSGNEPGKKEVKKSKIGGKDEIDPAKIRKEIAAIIDREATAMARAVVEEAKKGQLPTTKYLWEVAGLFPPKTDGTESSEHEDSLAETLLKRLNIPTTPIKLDEDEEPIVVPELVPEPSEQVGEEVVAG